VATDAGAPLQAALALAAPFDTVSVCFSKGLGTPVGSALCGPRDVIARALRVRKMLGGGWRQAGLLAAAALHALDHHVDRLADDHANARRLADGLQGLPGVTVQTPQTNIVFVDVDPARAHGVVERARAAGVLCTGLYRLRLVTHLDVNADDVDTAVAVLRRCL
jgi:threonine aldolase